MYLNILLLLGLLCGPVLGRVALCTLDSQIYPPGTIHAPCYESKWKNIIAFGNSWTENGYAHLTKESYISGDYLGRMTNGPTWAEYLSKLLGSDLYNFAFSGATANNSVVYRSTADVSEQIYMFQQTLRDERLDPQSSIYMLWTGVNDVHDIFVASKEGDVEPEPAINRVIASVYNELERLYAFSHARNFGVMGLAPIDKLPLFEDLSSDEKTDLQDLIKLYNHNMQNMIKKFVEKHTFLKQRKRQTEGSDVSKVKIYFFDSHSLFQTIFDDPDKHDLWILDKTCQPENTTQCRVPDRYLWWDAWHPTTATQKIIANGVVDLITL